MEFNYISISPSRTEKGRIIALYPYGRGQGVGTANPARPAGETGEARLGSPYGGAVAAGDRGGIPLRGFTKGEAKPPPLELNYIKPSPSRACEVENIPNVWAREGGRGGGYHKTFPAGETRGWASQNCLTLQARQRRPPAQGLATKKGPEHCLQPFGLV